jgi:hypothetical protein
MEADAQLESECRGHLGYELDRQLPRLASLGTPDLRVRNADLASEFALTDRGRSSSGLQFGRDPIDEEAAAPKPPIDRPLVERRSSMVGPGTYLRLIVEDGGRLER